VTVNASGVLNMGLIINPSYTTTLNEKIGSLVVNGGSVAGFYNLGYSGYTSLTLGGGLTMMGGTIN
jgi:hypothetical protein